MNPHHKLMIPNVDGIADVTPHSVLFLRSNSQTLVHLNGRSLLVTGLQNLVIGRLPDRFRKSRH